MSITTDNTTDNPAQWVPPLPLPPQPSSFNKKWLWVAGALFVLVTLGVIGSNNDEVAAPAPADSTAAPLVSPAPTQPPTTVDTRRLVDIGGPALSDNILTRQEFDEMRVGLLAQGVDIGNDAKLTGDLGLLICNLARESFNMTNFSNKMVVVYNSQDYFTMNEVAGLAAGLMLYMCYDEAQRLGFAS
jgi:hypothetical protein